MNLETFFDKFELFADAPNAVAKMRELVLQLAVQGKLVEQFSDDEPAEELVHRVAVSLPKKPSENPFLSKIIPTITAETDYELPVGWTWVPLGHLGIWATGCGFPKQYQGETEGEFLFCKVSDMNLPGNEVEIRTTVNAIDGEVMRKIRARANPVGTVIFPKIGGAIATHKRRLVVKLTIIDNNCSGIQPIGLTDNKWLLLLMRSIDLTKYQSGTSVPAVSQGALDPIRIGLPPLAEQKRIVAKADELMALCDRLEAQQRERDTQQAALARAAVARFADAPTPANIELLFHKSYSVAPADLRKTILTLAVQGKLVPQDPNDEPVKQMLLRILDEQRKLKRTTASSLRVREPNEMLDYDIPESWRWQVLEDLLVFGPANGFSPKAVEYETPVRSLTLSATTSGRFKPEYSKFIPSDIPEDSDLWLNDGDILVQRGNTLEYVGVSAVYHDEAHRFVYPDLMMKLRVSSKTDVGFVHLAMSSEPCRDFLRARASGTSGSMPKINQTTLKSLPLPLPPLAEQQRIVAKVDQLMALVDQLEAQLAASRAAATTLMDALVAELTAARSLDGVQRNPGKPAPDYIRATEA